MALHRRRSRLERVGARRQQHRSESATGMPSDRLGAVQTAGVGRGRGGPPDVGALALRSDAVREAVDIVKELSERPPPQFESSSYPRHSSPAEWS